MSDIVFTSASESREESIKNSREIQKELEDIHRKKIINNINYATKRGKYICSVNFPISEKLQSELRDAGYTIRIGIKYFICW